MTSFSSNVAFSRTLGWITEDEASTLANRRVAIAGVGGVGGHYCEVLARLGVRKFRISDPDTFDVVNFNRQNGSGLSSIGKKKVEVLRDRILDINPEAEVEASAERVTPENLDAFLKDVDLYLDGLDFFALEIRNHVFGRCQKLGIPAITVAPIGMGAALLVFTRDSMSFQDYFGISPELSREENAFRFLVGLSPTLIQRHYTVDRSRVNFAEQKVSSTPIGGYLCGGVAGATALKLLLGRGKVKVAPVSLHYDAYLNTYKTRRVFFGWRNPLQRLKVALLRKLVGSKPKNGSIPNVSSGRNA